MPKKEKTTPASHGKTLIKWQMKEFEQYDRGVLWYLFMGGIGLILLIYALWTANFLFAIILLIVAFIIYLHHRHDPEILDFKITEDGLEIDKDFFSYKELKKFWIIYEPPEIKNLYFNTYRILKGNLSIPLNSTDPLKVRKILLKYLDEDLEKENEEANDRWARWLRI